MPQGAEPAALHPCAVARICCRSGQSSWRLHPRSPIECHTSSTSWHTEDRGPPPVGALYPSWSLTALPEWKRRAQPLERAAIVAKSARSRTCRRIRVSFRSLFPHRSPSRPDHPPRRLPAWKSRFSWLLSCPVSLRNCPRSACRAGSSSTRNSIAQSGNAEPSQRAWLRCAVPIHT